MLGAVEGEAAELGVELGLDLHEARVGRRLLVEAVRHRGGEVVELCYLNILIPRITFVQELGSF